MSDQHINFKIDDNISDVLKRLDKMGKHLDDIQGGLEDIGDLTNKEILKGISEMEKGMSSFDDLVQSAVRDSDFGKNFTRAAKEVDGIRQNYEKLRKVQEEYQEATSEGNENLAKQKEIQYKETVALIRKEKKAVLSSMEDQSSRLKKIFIEDKKDLDKILKNDLPQDLGKGIGSAIQSALSGDLGGIIGGLTEGAGAAARYGGGRARNALDRRGMRNELSTGLPMGGKMGGVTRALGGIAKFLGPLAVAVGGVGMIVKLLMDAEAQTKDLNKALLDQVPYFALARGGFEGADQKLEQMREVATDFATNLRLGLDPKQHYEVIAALDEHGASLSKLEDEYDSFGDMAKDVIETVRIASLNLGVSMGEVSQFVATMQDVHGKSMSEIKEDLTSIVGLAAESGVSTKKFFGVVSQMTGQMGLYNFKLEDTAFLLTQMNKVMDSKSAEAFTTKMVTGLKEMNSQQKMQTMLLAGQGKVRKMLQDTSKKMYGQLEKDTGAFQLVFNDLFGGKFGPIQSIEEMRQMIDKMNRNEKNMLIARVQQEIGEGASQQLSRAIKMAEDSRKGGLSMIDAMNNLSGLDSMEIQISALENVFGSIESVPSILAEQLGIDQDGLKQMQRFSEVAKGNYALIQDQIAKDKAAGKTDEEIASRIKEMSERLGYGIKYDEVTGKLLDANGQVVKDQYDLLGAMNEEQKEKISEGAAMQVSAAERQVVATQSVTDVLKYLIADLLNSIGNQLVGINAVVLAIARHFTDVSQERVDMADAQSKVAGARSQLMRLERERKKALAKGDSGKVAQYDQGIASAKKRLASRQSDLAFMMENRDSLYDDEGAKRSGYDLTLAQRARQDKLGYKGSMSSFHAMENKALEDAHHSIQKSGVSTDSDSYDAKVQALQERLLEEAVNNEKLAKDRNEIQHQILEQAKEDSKKGISLNQTTNDILGQRGIKLSPDAITNFQMAMLNAQLNAEKAKEFMKAGFSQEASLNLAKAMSYGTQDGSAMNITEDHLRERYGVKNIDAKMRAGFTEATMGGRIVPATQDAKIMTKGVAPLQFAPGDLVVRQDSLARTLTGGPGAFAGQLVNQMGGGSRKGGDTNIYVTVSDPAPGQVRKEVMEVYEQIKRRQQGG